MTDCKDVKVHLRWKKPERRPLENHDTTNVQSRDSSADVVPSHLQCDIGVGRAQGIHCFAAGRKCSLTLKTAFW